MKRWLPTFLWGVVILVAVSPVLWHDGWPLSHEYLRSAERTLVYAEHWRQGDLLPVWSAADAYGLGTPLPLFYHRLFYFVSAPLYLLLGSLKISLVLSTAIFLWVGIKGMYSALRLAGIRVESAVWWAAWLPLLSYTFTDWLVRGAAAEFTASMIVPWLIWWALYSLRKDRLAWWVVPIGLALFLGHNVFSLFGVWIYLAVVWCLARRRSSWRRLATTVVLQTVLVVGMLAPLVLPMLFLRPVYDVSRILSFGFDARDNFPNVKSLLLHSDYEWKSTDVDMTIQLDFALTLFILVGAYHLIMRRRRVIKNTTPVEGTALVWALSVWYLFLILPPSRFLYEALPFLRFLQFPWRLLGYLGPLLIIIAADLVRRVWVRQQSELAVIGLLMLIVVSPALNYPGWWYTGQQLESLRIGHAPGATEGGSLMGIGEYLPRVEYGAPLADAWSQYPYFAGWSTDSDESCALKARETSWQESLTREYQIDCYRAGVVALPLNYSGWENVTVRRGEEEVGERVYSYRVKNDPRARLVLPAGVSEVTVQLPTLRRAWSAPFRSASRVF